MQYYLFKESSSGSKAGQDMHVTGGLNTQEGEPDFIETNCHWIECCKQFDTQDELVRVCNLSSLVCPLLAFLLCMYLCMCVIDGIHSLLFRMNMLYLLLYCCICYYKHVSPSNVKKERKAE